MTRVRVHHDGDFVDRFCTNARANRLFPWKENGCMLLQKGGAMATNSFHLSAPDSAAVLGKAVLRAAERLAINGDTLARVLGVSPASASRLAAGTYTLNPSR